MSQLDIQASKKARGAVLAARGKVMYTPSAISHEDCKAASVAYEAGDLLIDYLQQLEVDFIFGIPGGAIEPLYNALARSERKGGVKSIVTRHENGAAFAADGYARNSGKLGVCCATTGPGATNMITGVATAYENNIPLLVITAQTAVTNFGRKALQDSGDTGINTVGMYQFCTRYSTMITHLDQFERKLVTAIMTAFGPTPGPVHISVPLDIMRSKLEISKPSFNLKELLKKPVLIDDASVKELAEQLVSARAPVFVVGAGANESAAIIVKLAEALDAKIVTTPDGKGLVNPYHHLYRGVVGFAGHASAEQLLVDKNIDLIIAVGTSLGEWASSGWDTDVLLNNRLIHVESSEHNLTQSPMARLHVRGRLLAIFERLAADLRRQGIMFDAESNNELLDKRAVRLVPNKQAEPPLFDADDAMLHLSSEGLIKPQWLMAQITKKFAPHTKYLADAGNSFAWAIHYLHPFDRRQGQRRLREDCHIGRRNNFGGTFQAAIEYAPMGWAIASALGVALACKDTPIVCFTGDGSWLMSGLEITTAVQHSLPITYIILNDSALGMVKHGQRLGGAEQIAFELPEVNFSDMAKAVGANGYRVDSCQDFLALNFDQIASNNGPTVIDVRIDPEQVPPMGTRMKVLSAQS